MRGHLCVHLQVEPVLVVAERQPREQRILREHEVGDDRLREQPRLRERLHLLDALEQERELRLQGVARHVVVEALEEGIVLRSLEQQLRAESFCEAPRQRRLADADRPFDRDVAETRESVGHRVRRQLRKMK